MDAFAGQMYLCDLGASIEKCPDARGCEGPGGTKYSPRRMFPFEQWVTRNFAKHALKTIYPDKADEIDRLVDPGEYGLESYKCRLLCCFLFMLSLTSEFDIIMSMVQLLYALPTKGEMWFEYDPDTDSDVKIQLAGMPCHWKVVNVLVIVVPKLILWKLTCQAGINFLLDTSEIIDMVANCVALRFILNIDELLFENLTLQDTQDIMALVQGFNVNRSSEDVQRDIDDQIEQIPESIKLERDIYEVQNRCSIKSMFPVKLLFVIFLTSVFVANYYLQHCTKNSDGMWVPNDLHLPRSAEYTMLNFLAPSWFPIEEQEEPVWTMPSEKS